MTKQFQQYCPMSYALDLVGDRWTMHIIRDLMFGPLRYSDIQRGQPGLASNLLVKRLRDLETAGIVEKTQLPPPANVDVYALTQRGRGLRSVVLALTEWGLPLLPPVPPEQDFVGFAPFQGYLRVRFVPEKAEGVGLTCQIHTDDFSCYVTISNQTISAARGVHPAADVCITVHDLRPLASLMNRALSIDDALASGQVVLEDDATLPEFTHFVELISGTAAGEHSR